MKRRETKNSVNLFINSCSPSTVIDFVEALKKTPVRALASFALASLKAEDFLISICYIKFDTFHASLVITVVLIRVLFEHSL